VPDSSTPVADRLKPDPANANKGTDKGRALVEASLTECGAGRSILADRDGTVIAGNKTLEAARTLGLPIRVIETAGDELVVVQRTDLSLTDGEKARRLAYLDNRAGELGLLWDNEQMLADLRAGVDLEGVFDKAAIERLRSQMQGTPPVDPGANIDKAEELRERWGTETGQVWAAGVHRVACGDCRDAECLEMLMDGRRADVLWTDPPYGVSYVGKTKDALTIENDGAEDLATLLGGGLAAVGTVLAPSARFYIAAPAGPQGTVFRLAIAEVGWKLHEVLVWVKDAFVLGHSDYHYQHEDILYGFVPGEGRPGRGNHAGTQWFGGHGESTVFSVPRPRRSEEHPTMKPPELIAPMLRNSAKVGGAVLDPFCGSGSTLVACEQTGRTGFGCEIDPKYVAVALERLSLMGAVPRLMEG
jgi:site-specific DNA-methyltransferase (adenine-specific)